MKIALLTVLCLFALGAQGAQIFSCSVNGQTVYTNTPCGNGPSKVQNSTPAPAPKPQKTSPPQPSPPPPAFSPFSGTKVTEAPQQRSQPAPIAAPSRQSIRVPWWTLLLAPAALVLLVRKLRKKFGVYAPVHVSPRKTPAPEPSAPSPEHGAQEKEFSFQNASSQPEKKETSPQAKPDILPMRAKGLMSRYETAFLEKLKEALPNCVIFPQVPLAAFIEIDRKKSGAAFRTGSYRSQNYLGQKRVDYLICQEETYQILGAVELDDPSHENPEARERDRKKNVSLAEAGIPLHRWRVENPPTVEEIRSAILSV